VRVVTASAATAAAGGWRSAGGGWRRPETRSKFTFNLKVPILKHPAPGVTFYGQWIFIPHTTAHRLSSARLLIALQQSPFASLSEKKKKKSVPFHS
jgi:hypothetical protein